jgi:hypothetical protein
MDRWEDKLGSTWLLDEDLEGIWNADPEFFHWDERLRGLVNGMAKALSLALQSPDAELKVMEARRFLAARDEFEAYIRAEFGDAMLRSLTQLEWLDGLTGFVEALAANRALAGDALPEFESQFTYVPYSKVYETDYAGFERWLSDVGREYVDRRAFAALGKAQALLLDALCPDWRTRVLSTDLWMHEWVAWCLDRR